MIPASFLMENAALDLLTDFKAVYTSGLFIPEASTVSTLSLMFEKVYLPRNIDFIMEFSKKYQFREETESVEDHFSKLFSRSGKMRVLESTFSGLLDDDGSDVFMHLTDVQKQTAYDYLNRGLQFVRLYNVLFPEIFESVFYKGGVSVKIDYSDKESIKRATIQLTMDLDLSHGVDEFSDLIAAGYIPVIDNIWGDYIHKNKLDKMSARQLAALLAMKSIEIIFPKTRSVHPEIILEARNRLSDHLPPFWSAMLKLSVEMRKRIKECKSTAEIYRECQDIVDALVMPALIDLRHKIMKEKKDWYYKILSPIAKGLRVLIGNPPLTMQQILTSALILGSDVSMSAAENMRTIKSLQQEAGLTFLLEAQNILLDDRQHKKIRKRTRHKRTTKK